MPDGLPKDCTLIPAADAQDVRSFLRPLVEEAGVKLTVT